MASFIQSMRDSFAAAFLTRSNNLSKAGRNVLNKPNSKVIHPERYTGRWVEVARTNHSTPSNRVYIHDFNLNQDDVQYTVRHNDQTDPRQESHKMKLQTTNGQIVLQNPENRNHTLRVLGLYDENLTNQKTPVYMILDNPMNKSAWVLARPGYETNVNAAQNLIDRTRQAGYNLQTSPNNSNQDVLVPWNLSSFPENGTGRMINVKAGDKIRFISTDNKSHNVRQANLVKDSAEPSGYRWEISEYPEIDGAPTEVNFNKTLTLNRAGTYHLVCGVNDHRKIMRLTINITEPRNGNGRAESLESSDMDEILNNI